MPLAHVCMQSLERDKSISSAIYSLGFSFIFFYFPLLPSSFQTFMILVEYI